MDGRFKFDILEKLLQFLGLLYFVIGFFMNYAWTCKELDYVTNNDDILRFWEPIAGVTGILNIAHFILIVWCLYQNRNGTPRIRNADMNVLFYILAVPLFFISIIFIIIAIVRDSILYKTNGVCTIVLRIGELTFFCGTMSLILNINFKRPVITSHRQTQFLKFVMLISIIEMVNYFMFHLISQQVHNFVKIASNYSSYANYYGQSLLVKIGNPFHFNDIRAYMQPFVILFCCISSIYLIILNDLQKDNQKNILESQHHMDLEPLIESENENNHKNDVSSVNIFQSLRLPPLSIVLGILLLTLSLLIIILTNSFISTEGLYDNGQLMSTTFSIIVYIFAIILLFIQINEMQRWPLLKKNENIVDKILTWIGMSGQLIISVAQIKLNVFTYSPTLSIILVFQYVCLIFQMAMQYIVVSLAFDREWLPPPIKTWQEYICPSVGMLSINFGFLFYSIFDVITPNSINKFQAPNEPRLFLNLFGLGFQSFGETLAILQRLHSILIFGRMIVVTNRTK